MKCRFTIIEKLGNRRELDHTSFAAFFFRRLAYLGVDQGGQQTIIRSQSCDSSRLEEAQHTCCQPLCLDRTAGRCSQTTAGSAGSPQALFGGAAGAPLALHPLPPVSLSLAGCGRPQRNKLTPAHTPGFMDGIEDSIPIRPMQFVVRPFHLGGPASGNSDAPAEPAALSVRVRLSSCRGD